MVAVLKACGDNLTRENVMKQATSCKCHAADAAAWYHALNQRDDFAPIKRMQLEKFDGTTWKLFGEVISASGS